MQDFILIDNSPIYLPDEVEPLIDTPNTLPNVGNISSLGVFPILEEHYM